MNSVATTDIGAYLSPDVRKVLVGLHLKGVPRRICLEWRLPAAGLCSGAIGLADIALVRSTKALR